MINPEELNLPAATIDGWFGFVSSDGPDEDDAPDITLTNGTVRFVATTEAARVEGAWLGIEPVDARILNGRIVTDVEHQLPVRLLATDANIGVADWAWKASFDVPGFRLNDLTFRAPRDTTVNLTADLIPIKSQPYQIIEGASIVDAEVSGEGTMRFELSDGSYTSWMDVPNGERGVPGPPGEQGEQGEQGEPGPAPTLSMGSVATGTTGDAWMTGTPLARELNLILPRGQKGERGEQGIPGTYAGKGDSAYQVAVDNGFTGTEAEWLASLQGEKGERGPEGPYGGTEVTDPQVASYLLPGMETRSKLTTTLRDLTTPAGLAPLKARLHLRDTHPVFLAFAGSSTTAGTNVTAEYRWVNRIAKKVTTTPVPHNIAALRLVDIWDEPGISLANVGRSGATSETYLTLEEATEIGGMNPALVMHSVGANDNLVYLSTGSTADWAANVEARIDAIDAAATLPVGHVLMHQHQRYDFANRPQVHPWEAYLIEAQNIATRRRNVSVLNLDQYFRAVGIPDSDPLGMMESDKAHVNEDGYAFYAEVIGDFLHLPPYVVKTLVDDDFERLDSPASLGRARTGQAWTVHSGDGLTWGIADGAAGPTSPSGSGFVSVDAATTDVTVRTYLAATADSDGDVAGIAAWVDGPGNGVYVAARQTYYEFGVVIGGSRQIISRPGPPPVAGDVIELVTRGTVVDVHINGARWGGHSNLTALPRATGVGFFSLGGSAGAARFDAITVTG